MPVGSGLNAGLDESAGVMPLWGKRVQYEGFWVATTGQKVGTLGGAEGFEWGVLAGAMPSG